MLQQRSFPRSVTWEKALPLLIYDNRYLSFPKQYRKLVFDDFMKKNSVQKIREEMIVRQEIEQNIKKMMDEYLESGKITAQTEYKDFEIIAKQDPRFIQSKLIEKEGIYSEFIKTVAKAKNDMKEKQKIAFRVMLNELNQSNLNEFSKWKEVKKNLKSDPRYKAVSSKKEREKLFFEHITELLEQREKRYGNKRKRGFPEKEVPKDKEVEELKTKKDDQKLLSDLFKDHITHPGVIT